MLIAPLALLTLDASATAFERLPHLVSGVRRSTPSATLILRVTGGSVEWRLQLAGRAGRLGVLAIVGESARIEELRPVLSSCVDLGSQVIEWLHHSCGRQISSATVVSSLCRVFDDPLAYPNLATLARSGFISPGGLRAAFRGQRLGPPHEWLRAAHGIAAALRIQASPEKSLRAVSDDLRLTDQSRLNHLLRRYFEVAPSQLRGTLGWRWLLDRWARRTGLYT